MIDRSILLQLRSIAPSRRRREQDLWAEFMQDYPGILGGLLDAVAAGRGLWSEIHVPELERMADFTHWGEAVAAVGVGWPPGTFREGLSHQSSGRQLRVPLEESLLGAGNVGTCQVPHGPWKGTPTQLLELIGEWTGYASCTTPGWPKTPSRASVELRRIAAQLRMFGLSVTFERGPQGERLVNFVPDVADGRFRAKVG